MLPSSEIYEPNFHNVSVTSSDPLCDLNGHSPFPETCLQIRVSKWEEADSHLPTDELLEGMEPMIPLWFRKFLPIILKAIGKASKSLIHR